MSKHTPGPWRVGNTDPLLFGRPQGNGSEPIGFVYGPSFPERSEVGQRALANARMCAAAPDLLEALAEMREAWEEQFGEGACDCQPEPENAGHVCQCCKAPSRHCQGHRGHGMRWRADEDDAARLWHRWFAWHPVRIGGTSVWLKTVMRREVFVPCHPCGELELEYRDA